MRAFGACPSRPWQPHTQAGRPRRRRRRAPQVHPPSSASSPREAKLGAPHPRHPPTPRHTTLMHPPTHTHTHTPAAGVRPHEERGGREVLPPQERGRRGRPGAATTSQASLITRQSRTLREGGQCRRHSRQKRDWERQRRRHGERRCAAGEQGDNAVLCAPPSREAARASRACAGGFGAVCRNMHTHARTRTHTDADARPLSTRQHTPPKHTSKELSKAGQSLERPVLLSGGTHRQTAWGPLARAAVARPRPHSKKEKHCATPLSSFARPPSWWH